MISDYAFELVGFRRLQPWWQQSGSDLQDRSLVCPRSNEQNRQGHPLTVVIRFAGAILIKKNCLNRKGQPQTIWNPSRKHVRYNGTAVEHTLKIVETSMAQYILKLQSPQRHRSSIKGYIRQLSDSTPATSPTSGQLMSSISGPRTSLMGVRPTYRPIRYLTSFGLSWRQEEVFLKNSISNTS